MEHNLSVNDFDMKCSKIMYLTRYNFTKKECEILVLSCHSYSPEMIALSLSRSVKTVRKHMENLKKKTPFSKYREVVKNVTSVMMDQESASTIV